MRDRASVIASGGIGDAPRRMATVVLGAAGDKRLTGLICRRFRAIGCDPGPPEWARMSAASSTDRRNGRPLGPMILWSGWSGRGFGRDVATGAVLIAKAEAPIAGPAPRTGMAS